MAVAGATDEEIGDVTGQTLQTVQHYTKNLYVKLRMQQGSIQARERWLEAQT